MNFIGDTVLAGEIQVASENTSQFDDDDLDSIDDYDDDLDTSDDPEEDEDPVEMPLSKAEEEEKRRQARRAIERRNELKALQSELDEWDDPIDDLDL